MSRAARTWPVAARDLAGRVERRARLGKLAAGAGTGLLVGAPLALLLRALAAPDPLPLALVASGSVAGLAWGLWAASRLPATAPADAAWALDRLAEARGRGLAAATLTGSPAAEAAWAPPQSEPPAVRMLPPRGLAPLLAGLLVAAIAVVAPSREPGGEAAPDRALPVPAGLGRAEAAEAADLAGERQAADASAAEAVRAALGLTPQAAEDPARLAERLAEPDVREAAREAAPEGSELALLLASEGDVAEDLAAALGAGRAAEAEAREARRRAALLRAASPRPTLPPGRRPLLERYFGQRPGGPR